jgi:hypothetical protein
MKGWIPSTFSAEDRKVIEHIGGSRRGSKVAAGIQSAVNLGLELELEGQVHGFAAEWALARLLGAEVDKTINLSGNDGVHLVTPHGTFNAAFASKAHYNMRYMPDRVPPVDRMVLVTGNLETMWLIGYVSREEFMALARPKDYGYGWRLALPQGELRPISLLVEELGLQENASLLRDIYRSHLDNVQGSLFT